MNYFGSKLISKGYSLNNPCFAIVMQGKSSGLELKLGDGWEFLLTLAISLKAGKYFLLQEGLTKKLLSHSSKIPDSSFAKFSKLVHLLFDYSLNYWGWWDGGKRKISLKFDSCFSFDSMWVSINSDLSLWWESNSSNICFIGHYWGWNACFSGSGFKGKC